ncbi:MAG: hypothetical protein ACI4WH_02805 [Oscillospiraceae bacterium]
MAKQCRFCGAEMDDNAIKCPECEKLVPNAEIILDKQRQAKKKRNTIILVVLVCLVLIVAIAIISEVVSKKKTGYANYVSAIDANLSSMVDNQPEKYLNTYPKFIRSEIEETLGYLAENGFNEYFDLMHDEITKIYGSNIAISYEVVTKTHMEQDSIDEYVSNLNDYFNNDDENIDYNIQDAYQLGVSITINGTTGNQTLNKNIAVMQIDNAWYIMNLINIAETQVDTLKG